MANRSRAEKKNNKPKLSTQAQAQAQAITDVVAPVSFTKQQRREVKQAIEKGMQNIRTQTKTNNRERDKKHKQLQKELEHYKQTLSALETNPEKPSRPKAAIPWGLLLLSWLFFSIYALSRL